MIRKAQNEYEPDYVSPPGETLRDILESLRMTQASLARRMGRPVKTVNEIIKGKTAITPETALQLERVLGIPASFWNNREKQYRAFSARDKETRRMKRNLDWLDKFPLKEMIKLGWIEKRKKRWEQLVEVLRFFGVASPKEWEDVWNACSVQFRRSQAFQSNPGALTAWLRRGEIEAQNIQVSDYDSSAFRRALRDIRALTRESPNTFVPKMTGSCAQSGIAVAFVPEIKGSRIYGATRWLTPRKALIQLSLRGKTDDHLWFTFFHEAAHILMHGKRRIFLEGLNDRNDFEEKADSFSVNHLIPERKYNSFVELKKFTKNSIKQFAKNVDIAPGIAVGRLQHDGFIDYSYCNDLKLRLHWANR